MLPRQPADAAAEGVADDADVVRRAVQRGEAVLGRRRRRRRPRASPAWRRGRARRRGRPRRRACRDVLTRMVSSSGVVRRGAWPVPWAATRRPRVAGEVDDGDDVVDGLGERDGGGALVDGEVPGVAGVVPAGVGRGRRAGRARRRFGARPSSVRAATLSFSSVRSSRAPSLARDAVRARCGSPHGPRAPTGVQDGAGERRRRVGGETSRRPRARARASRRARPASGSGRPSEALARSASPGDDRGGDAERARLVEDVADDLSRERGGVEAALAGEDERCAPHRVAQADDVGDERRAGDEPRAVGGEAAGEAARRARAGQRADVDPAGVAVAVGEPLEPSLELRDAPRRRRPSADRRRAPRRRTSSSRRTRRRRRRRAGRSRAPRARRARRRPSPSRRPRRSARRTPVSSACPEELARAMRRRAQRVVAAGDEREAARAGHLDDGRVAAKAPLGLDGLAERSRDTRTWRASGDGQRTSSVPSPPSASGRRTAGAPRARLRRRVRRRPRPR